MLLDLLLKSKLSTKLKALSCVCSLLQMYIISKWFFQSWNGKWVGMVEMVEAYAHYVYRFLCLHFNYYIKWLWGNKFILWMEESGLWTDSFITFAWKFTLWITSFFLALSMLLVFHFNFEFLLHFSICRERREIL